MTQTFNKALPHLDHVTRKSRVPHSDNELPAYLMTEMTCFAVEELNLRDAPALKRPLLTIHSKTDSLFPFSTALRAHEWAIGEKELIAYDHEWHVCRNHMAEFVPMFCDWMNLDLDGREA